MWAARMIRTGSVSCRETRSSRWGGKCPELEPEEVEFLRQAGEFMTITIDTSRA
jgi:hypothetical protein